MNWILENWDKISAFLIGAYGAARLFVVITPTKTDNEWLKKIGDTLSTIFGLDVTKGIQ
ncbi:MAG: hypothetical protein ACTSXA_00640 [Candidatus Heimdallarchaeota archaeon]